MATGVGNAWAGNEITGGIKITTGFGGAAFGLARMISGLHGQKIETYGGMGEAIAKKMGVNGTVGATVDILSGGKPETVTDGLILFKSIYDLFGPHSTTININPSVMQQDQTMYVRPLLKQ